MKRFFLMSAMLFVMVISAMAQDVDSLYAKDLLKKGDVAPEFTLNTIEGKTLSLKDYRGKYVVLDFWASWCPDCRKDIPEVKKLYSEYAAKNVVFISVSFDTVKEAWQNCVTKKEMTWHQVSSLKKWKETQISKDYHVNWIPSMYLLDPEGKVVLGTVMIEKIGTVLGQLK